MAKKIDHVLVDGRWRMIQNCRVYRRAQFLNTDHWLVVATVKLEFKSRRMAPSQPRLDVGKLKDERVAEELANKLSGDVGGLSALGDPEEVWSASRPPSLMLLMDVLEPTVRRRKNFFSRGTLDTIDQSRRARLNGRAELLGS